MQGDCSRLVSTLFFKRFLKRPFQIASIVPSSKALVERVASKMDFSQPRVIAEYGPGEGVHSREIARRMCPDSHLLLFELDRAFARDLERQFADDRRVRVIHGDAASLPHELQRHRIDRCDYILSGIPFSILKIEKKRALLQKTYDALAPGGNFIIYLLQMIFDALLELICFCPELVIGKRLKGSEMLIDLVYDRLNLLNILFRLT